MGFRRFLCWLGFHVWERNIIQGHCRHRCIWCRRLFPVRGLKS